MQGTHLAGLTVYWPRAEASAVIFFLVFFPSCHMLPLLVTLLVALTHVSLHSGLQSFGNRNIAQVGSCLLKIINMKRTESYMSAHFYYNYMLI